MTDYSTLMLAQLAPQFASMNKPRDPYAARRAFGMNVLQQGMSTQPVRSPLEGLARALQAGLGGYFLNKVDTEQDTREKADSSALSAALQATGPDGKPDIGAITTALSRNPKYAGIAATLRLSGGLQAQQAAAERAKYYATYGGGPGGAAPPATALGGAPGAAPGGVFEVPQQWQTRIAELAQRYGIDPKLIASTIWNESRWNPNAVNPNDQGPGVDSVGIGQWGQQWAKARGFDPRDPNASLEHTAMALRELADKYGGNVLLARLAYGWGPGNTDKWLQAGGDPNKLPDGARIWLPRTALGIADDAQARAAFPQIVQYLRPGVRFDYGNPQVAPGPAPAPVAGPPMAPPEVSPMPLSMGQPTPGGIPGGPPNIASAIPPTAPQVAPQPQGMPPAATPQPARPTRDPGAVFVEAANRAAAAGDYKRASELQNQAIAARAAAANRPPVRREINTGSEIVVVDENDQIVARYPKQPDAGAVSDNIDNMRKEIASLPEVKAYGTVIPIYNSMVNAAKVNGKAADLDLIYGLAKILDPGSVVREGETIMVLRTGGIFDQIKGWASGVSGGAALPPDVRAGIMQIATSRTGEYQKAADAVIAPYQDIVKRRGWNAGDVMPGRVPLQTFTPADTSTMPRPTQAPAAPTSQKPWERKW